MKHVYAQFYTIVQQGAGFPYTPNSVGIPSVEYDLPECMISLELLEIVISKIRFNFEFLGFCLKGDKISAGTQL